MNQTVMEWNRAVFHGSLGFARGGYSIFLFVDPPFTESSATCFVDLSKVQECQLKTSGKGLGMTSCGGFHGHGGTPIAISWKIPLKGMITRGTPILGHPDVCHGHHFDVTWESGRRSQEDAIL